jgi:hypothetical protein
VPWLLVTANFPSAQILVTLMMKAMLSSETAFLEEPHCVTLQKTAVFKYIIFRSVRRLLATANVVSGPRFLSP